MASKKKIWKNAPIGVKVDYWWHTLFVFSIVTNAFWFTVVTRTDQRRVQVRELAAHYADCFHESQDMTVYWHKQFWEMRDYSWKLEHALAKCKRGKK